MARFSSSMASTRRTRSTSQTERGIPLSRMALWSRLVGACSETRCRWCASSASAIARISGLIEYSKWLREQKISTPWKPAPAICSRSSGVNFRDTNRYVDSSLCMISSKNLFPLVSHGGAVVARVGCAQPVAGSRINGDRVDEPHVSDATSGVAASVQGTLQAVWKSALDQNAIGQPLVVEARRIDGGLGLHAETHPIDYAQQRRGNNLGPTRRARDETQFSIAEQNRGCHRAQRSVTWSDGVGIGLHQAEESVRDAGLGGEVIHLVVQKKACGAGGMRAVAVVERIGAGDGVAGSIHDGKMGGVRAFAQAHKGLRHGCVARGNPADVRIPGLDDFARRGVLRIDGGGNFPGVAGIGEAGDGNVRIVGIGQIRGAIRKNAAHHFSNHVNAFDVVPAFERNTLQHVERLNDRDATRAGRGRSQDFPGMAIAIVLGAQNFADFRPVLGEIFERYETAEPRHVIHKRASGFAAIELGRALPSDAFESGGKFRLTERISRLKHFAVVQKDPAANGEPLQSGVLFFEFAGEPLADRKAIFSKANGWGHNVRELHRAIAFQSESEAGDGSWDSDGLVAHDRRFFFQLSILADVHIPGGFARSGFAIVQESSFAIGKTN